MSKLEDFAHRFAVCNEFSVAERVEQAIHRSSLDEIEAAVEHCVIRFWDNRLCAELIRACAMDGNRPEVVKALHDLLEDSDTDQLDEINKRAIEREENEIAARYERDAA